MLARAGLNPRLLTFGMMGLLFAIGLAALAVSERTALTQFALASFVDRIAFHHQLWDNVMLIFLLVALGKKAFAPLRPLYAAGFFVVGVSLWLPGYFVVNIPGAVPYQILAWFIGFVHRGAAAEVGDEDRSQIRGKCGAAGRVDRQARVSGDNPASRRRRGARAGLPLSRGRLGRPRR